jgi:hypothetical protein
MHVPDIPENLTRQEIARRVLLACQNIRILPDRERKFLLGPAPNSIWREVIPDYPDEEVRDRPPRPSPREVTDCMVVLGWCAKLEKRDFRLIWAYSFAKVNFSLIAGRYGRSDETIRIWYWRAIDKVWAIALAEAGFGKIGTEFGKIGG